MKYNLSRMKYLIGAIACYCVLPVHAQDKATVFSGGADGYKNFRIPAIIKTPKGTLLAFCEGRKNSSSDFGDIDVVMKSSTDGGKTWGALQVVADNDTLQAGNPAPVVDVTDKKYPKGRIFLFYNTGSASEEAIKKGQGVREAFYKTSVDNGITWSKPVNITSQVHRPKQPGINARYNNTQDWRWFATLPGHAMQFQRGKYKGRIFVATNHSEGGPQKQNVDIIANGFFTKNHGKTFSISPNIKIPGTSESTAAELSGNKLMMSSRNQKYDVKARVISISSNGGASWDTSYYDEQLPDPVCEGSLLSLGLVNKKSMLAFCNNADKNIRDNLTLRISDDDGKTWFKNIVVDRHPDNLKNMFVTYSDLVRVNASTIGVLYERNNYGEIMFAPVQWK